jgi:hypothetical protein
MEVSSYGQTYSADESTLTQTGTQFAIKALGVDAAQIAAEAIIATKIPTGGIIRTKLAASALPGSYLKSHQIVNNMAGAHGDVGSQITFAAGELAAGDAIQIFATTSNDDLNWDTGLGFKISGDGITTFTGDVVLHAGNAKQAFFTAAPENTAKLWYFINNILPHQDNYHIGSHIRAGTPPTIKAGGWITGAWNLDIRSGIAGGGAGDIEFWVWIIKGSG